LTPSLPGLESENPTIPRCRLLQRIVRDTWQLGWWILSQGAGIEVLGPGHLREKIAQEIDAAHARYRPATPGPGTS